MAEGAIAQVLTVFKKSVNRTYTKKELSEIIEENKILGIRIKGVVLTDTGLNTGKFVSYIKM